MMPKDAAPPPAAAFEPGARGSISDRIADGDCREKLFRARAIARNLSVRGNDGTEREQLFAAVALRSRHPRRTTGAGDFGPIYL